MAVLIGMSGDVKGKSFPLDREQTTLGRSKDNTIVIEHATVSGHHCAVVRTPEGYRLRDLESTNGTRLNAKDVEDEPLHGKDLFQVGSIEFMFDDGSEGSAAAQEFATANVEVADGPIERPTSFASISPFGARKQQKQGSLQIVSWVASLLALAAAIWFFVRLLA